MTGQQFAMFDTAIGACGVIWGARGISGVQLPMGSPDKTRNRIHQRNVDIPEAEPPADVQRAIAHSPLILYATLTAHLFSIQHSQPTYFLSNTHSPLILYPTLTAHLFCIQHSTAYFSSSPSSLLFRSSPHLPVLLHIPSFFLFLIVLCSSVVTLEYPTDE